MSQILFNGVAVATPKTFKPSFKDLDGDSTTRNAQGYMMRDRIRGAMRTLHFEWGLLTNSEISTILQSISPSQIPVYYFDPMDNTWETRTMYCGDRETEAEYDIGSGLWSGLAFDLVEV